MFARVRAPGFLALSIILLGCDAKLSDAPGQYSGMLREKKSNAVTYTLVAAELNTPVPDRLAMHLESRDDSSQKSTYTLTKSHGSVILTLPDSTDVTLKSNAEECYAGTTKEGELSANVCFNGRDLLLALQWKSNGDSLDLELTRSDSIYTPPMEQPKAYTLDELLHRSMEFNFQTAGQYHNMLRSKYATTTAFTNLLPTVNINTVLNMLGLTVLSDMKAVGDLVPFLFPTRWLKAFDAKFESQAEFDGWILAKANAANFVQGLSYTMIRDQSVIDMAEQEAAHLNVLVKLVDDRVHAGRDLPVSEDNIGTVRDDVVNGLEDLKGTQADVRAAVAHAAGFFNPAAIDNILFQDKTIIEDVKPFADKDVKYLTELAQTRSYELRQLEALKKAANLEQIASYFQWMDPSGDHDGNLGINIIFYAKSKKLKKTMIQDKIEDVVSQIKAYVKQITNAANEDLKRYARAKSILDRQNRRIQFYESSLHTTGIGFSMPDFTDALRKKLQAEIEVQHAKFAYLTVRADLDRLLLTGPYGALPTDKGDPSWAINTGSTPGRP